MYYMGRGPAHAKISGVLWRDNARAAYHVWGSKFGYESAIEHAKKLIPRPLAKEWSSISRTENVLVPAGAHRVCAVLTDVLQRYTQVSETADEESAAALRRLLSPLPAHASEGVAAVAAPVVALTDPHMQDQREHSVKMGRWRRLTCDLIKDNWYWEALCERYFMYMI